jgi:hypothetical protein
LFALAYRKEALTIVISVHKQEYSILERTQRSIKRVEQAGKSLSQRSTNQLVVWVPVSFDQSVESIGLACQLTTLAAFPLKAIES